MPDLNYSDYLTIRITRVRDAETLEPLFWDWDLVGGQGGTSPNFFGATDSALNAISELNPDWVKFDANNKQTKENMTETKSNDVINDLIAGTLSRTSNQVIDSILNLVVAMKAESASRADDYEIGQDDAFSAVIAKIHSFQLHLNKAASEANKSN